MDDGGFRQANKQVKHRTQYKMYVVSKKYAAMGGGLTPQTPLAYATEYHYCFSRLGSFENNSIKAKLIGM